MVDCDLVSIDGKPTGASSADGGVIKPVLPQTGKLSVGWKVFLGFCGGLLALFIIIGGWQYILSKIKRGGGQSSPPISTKPSQWGPVVTESKVV